MATALGASPTSPRDLASLIAEDHAKIRHLFSLYQVALTPEVKQQLVWHMIREGTIHASKEEDVLYPMTRQVLGEEEYHLMLDSNLNLKHCMARLDALNPHSQEAEVDAQVKELIELYEFDMQHEERVLLPTLTRAPGVDVVKLGCKFDRAAVFAPTRPHPWAPRSQPWDILVKLVAAPVDHLKDLVRFVGYIPPVVPTATAA